MKDTGSGQDFRTIPEPDDLDRELAQMAGEAPPMPADFHAGWMKAVRAEAAGGRQPAEEPEKRPARQARTIRILSTAAAFVFLIGGTFLYRLGGGNSAVNPGTDAADNAVPAENTNAWDADAAAFTAGGAMDADAAAGYSDAPASAERKFALKADSAVPEEAPLAMMAEESAEEAYDAAEAAETEETEAEAEEAEPVNTADEPEENTADAGKEAAGSESQPEERKDALQEIGEFMVDMGRFLLAALPYLLLCGCAAAAVLVWRRSRERRGGREF